MFNLAFWSSLHSMLLMIVQRKWVQQLRWQDDLSPKDQPQPELPDGPAHRLSQNFYHLRDNRRKYLPDIVIAPQQKRLTGSSELTQGLL